MATKSTIVLCEDETHWLFVYRWLLERGLTPNELRLVPLPAGRRAGFMHVFSGYAQEVCEYRRKANHLQSRRLIVVLDGDISTVSQRLAELGQRLTSAGVPPRELTERICILVPCRNGETWIHFFHGHQVDETTDYKPFYSGDAKASACAAAGKAFEHWQKGQPTPGSPPSLVASRSEASRV